MCVGGASIGARSDRSGGCQAIRLSSSADGNSPRGSIWEGASFCIPTTIGKIRTIGCWKCCLTAPQVVAQWINMEHYFSAVDNEVYGSGSKIYHNVVGRIGIMSGPWSDLRLGLARQTVMNGDVPYHEPMRLLTVIEAPR